jgi:hypothetical protein
VVVGTIEDFRPESLPTPSVKARKQVTSEKKSPDASTLGSKLLHRRFAFNRGMLKTGAVALVLLIAILAWHQLGAQPVTSRHTVAATLQTSEFIAIASQVTAKDTTQKDHGPAIVEPASSAVPLANTNINPETATAHGVTAPPAVQLSAAPPARSELDPACPHANSLQPTE